MSASEIQRDAPERPGWALIGRRRRKIASLSPLSAPKAVGERLGFDPTFWSQIETPRPSRQSRNITDSNAVRAIPAHGDDRARLSNPAPRISRMNAHDIMRDLSRKHKRLPKAALNAAVTMRSEVAPLMRDELKRLLATFDANLDAPNEKEFRAKMKQAVKKPSALFYGFFLAAEWKQKEALRPFAKFLSWREAMLPNLLSKAVERGRCVENPGPILRRRFALAVQASHGPERQRFRSRLATANPDPHRDQQRNRPRHSPKPSCTRFRRPRAGAEPDGLVWVGSPSSSISA